MYIFREITKELKENITQFPVVALTGARQTGKTTILRHILKDEYEYFDLDDLDLQDRAKRDPKLFINSASGKIIVDEIQYAPELLRYIKMKVDENPRLKGRYILTGSQQFLMMKNLSETLAGRVGIVNLYPLSKDEINKNNSLKDSFTEACIRGTYPGLVTEKNIDSERWYKNYIQTYVERDVKILYNIGDLRTFNHFVIILASRVGQLLNMNSISIELGVAVNTIKSWLSVLVASNIVYLLHPYYKNVGKKLIKTPKVYFIDNGLVSYLNKITTSQNLFSSSLVGPLFENYIIIEILKKFKNRGKDCEIIFFRDHAGLEVDLIIKNRDKLIPVEIKAGMSAKYNTGDNIEKFVSMYDKENIVMGYLVNLGLKSERISEHVKTAINFDFVDN